MRWAGASRSSRDVDGMTVIIDMPARFGLVTSDSQVKSCAGVGARYGELERALPGIPSNLLAERLRLLEVERIAERDAERAYRLTPKGRELAPVLASLATWGLRHYATPSSATALHSGCGGRVHTR